MPGSEAPESSANRKKWLKNNNTNYCVRLKEDIMNKLLKELIVSWIFNFLFVFVHMKLIGWCLNTHWTVRTIAGVWILLEMIEYFVKGGSGK